MRDGTEPVRETSKAPLRAPGDSVEQRAAEAVLVASLAQQMGIVLQKRRLELPGGSWLELDGFSQSPPIACEAWAHIGKAKVAQKWKPMTDALKLIFAAQFLPKETRKILVVADAAAIHHLRGRGWMAQALKANSVELQTVDLPEETVAGLRRAQQRQFR